MNLRYLIAAVAALLISFPATASIKTLVRAVETSSKLLSVPTTPNGRMLIRSCEQCELHSPRLAAYTDFSVGDERLSFAEFRRAYHNLRGQQERFVLVAYDVETNTVTSVQVAD